MPLVTTFVNWRATLVAMQGALGPGSSVTQAQSAYGYSLLQQLTADGAVYDANGDDSPLNAGAFSVSTCQPYMDAATPTFIELDRISRYTYALYASTVTLEQGQSFGLYSGLSSLPPGIATPAPLVFLWQTATTLWSAVIEREATATDLAVTASNTGLQNEILAAYTAANPYFAPPVNPSPPSEALSVAATNAINADILACTTWLGTLGFS